MLTPRENLLKALNHEIPERVPILCHVDPYNQPSREGIDPELDRELGEVKWGDGAGTKLSRYLGLDILDWLPNPVAPRFQTVEEERKSVDSETTTTWHTPRGDLQEVVRVASDGRTSYRTKHFLECEEDLPAFTYAMADRAFDVKQDLVETIRQRREEIGEQGIQSQSVPGTPLGMLIRVYSGPEAVAFLYADAPDELEELFAVMEESHREMVRLIIENSEVDAIIGMDDTSTATQSPAMFERYCVPYTNRMADLVHELGRYYWHHSCGHIRKLLPLYKQTRMDAVHAYTVPPTGDARIRDAKDVLGEDIAIIAGLKVLEGTMDDRERAADEVRGMFDEARPGSNFILNMTAYQHQPVSAMEWLRDECLKYSQLS